MLPADDQPVAEIALAERAQVAVLPIPLPRRDLGAQALHPAVSQPTPASARSTTCPPGRAGRDRPRAGSRSTRRTRRRSRPAREPASMETTSRCRSMSGRARARCARSRAPGSPGSSRRRSTRRRRTRARSRRAPAGARCAASRRSPVATSCQWCIVEHGHRGVEGVVAETGDASRERADCRCRAGRALRDHRLRRLDRDDDAIGRFVGPGAGADVHTVRGVAEGGMDAGFDPRVGDASPGVRRADAVVLGGAPRRVHGKRAQQRDHLDGRRRRFFALVAFLARRAGRTPARGVSR